MPRAGQIIRAADFDGFAAVTQDTAESGVTSTTFIPGTAVCGTTFVAPTSGRVVVNWAARVEVNTSSARAQVTVQVREGATIGSGTVVSGISGPSSVEIGITADIRLAGGTIREVTGLTPGSTYNVQTMHAVSSGTADILSRRFVVTPIP